MKSLGNFPDPFRAEIGAQPEALRRAASSLEVQRDRDGHDDPRVPTSLERLGYRNVHWAVLVVGTDTDGPSRAMRLGVGRLHRLLAPAVSVIPAQLLAWRLALARGREPGTYTRASKVSTRE